MTNHNNKYNLGGTGAKAAIQLTGSPERVAHILALIDGAIPNIGRILPVGDYEDYQRQPQRLCTTCD